MPAKSEKQRRFMGAELARKREGKKTRTDMSEDKLGEFASKQKLNYRGAWIDAPVSSKRNVGLNRAIATESKGIAAAARKEKRRKHATAYNEYQYGKSPFRKEEVANMNHQDFASQLDKHINHLEKRHTYTHEEAREVFDRDAVKVISERQRKRDAELRRERGLPSNNLEKRHMNTPEESRESFDRMAEKEQRQRDFEHDNELRRKRGEPEKPVTHVDRGAVHVVKSNILHPKYLLPAQDSDGNFVPNDTIPFTQETNKLMSLAADAIEKYITKEHEDEELPARAVRRNKKEASKRKMKVSGAGAKDSQRIIGRKAAKARGELVY